MLNLRNIEQHQIGQMHGIVWSEALSTHQTRLHNAKATLLARCNQETAMLGWMQLPTDQPALEAALTLAAQLGHYTDLVVLGIGGSSLGGIAVIEALKHPYRHLQKNGAGLRVHFIDNVDGDVIASLLEVLDPKTTLVNVISKSGTTTETMSAYLICKSWLEQHIGTDWAKQIIASTDPQKGVLRPMVEKYGFRSLSVPPSVGGRFSVLSAVGTLPIALAGLDVRGLMAGAAKAQQDFETQSALENPALQLALVTAEFAAKGKPMLVLMPYSSRLKFVSDWFAQLWAESLGKIHANGSHTGTTPIKSFGATDQHSVMQLFMEGPNDKLLVFIRLEQDERGTRIPNAEPSEPDMNYLADKPFQVLLNAEQAATANALATMQRPNITISLEQLSAQNLGYLLQTLMLTTAVVGELWGIDAFNQPGAELGKKFTYALMGRPGFEAVKAELEANGVT